MSFIWFNLVLEALGKKLNYESISNLYGNSFAKDSADIISRCNPLIKTKPKNTLVDYMKGVTIVKSDGTENTGDLSGLEDVLGDMSWIDMSMTLDESKMPENYYKDESNIPITSINEVGSESNDV